MRQVLGQWGRRKPTARSRLNPGHPLTRRLTGCWMLSEGGGNRLYNHAQNNYSTINLGTIGWVTDPLYGGWGLASLPTTSVTAGITIAPVIPATATTGVTVEISLVDLGSDVTALLAGSDGIYRGLYLRANKLDLVSSVGVDVDSTGAIGTHRRRHLVATAANNTANHEYYFDGQLDSSLASSFGSMNWNVLLNNVFAADETFVGLLSYMRIWDRGVIATEVQELCRDPFGMFDMAWHWSTLLGAAGSAVGPGGRFFPFFH